MTGTDVSQLSSSSQIFYKVLFIVVLSINHFPKPLMERLMKETFNEFFSRTSTMTGSVGGMEIINEKIVKF